MEEKPLNLMCLAVFAAFYMYKRNVKDISKDPKTGKQNMENKYDFSDDDEGSAIGNWIKLLKNDGYIRKRQKPRIIRYRGYNKLQDPDNYYREQLMLYIPWRDEHAELLNGDIKQRYVKSADKIRELRNQFNTLGSYENFEELLDAVRNAEIQSEKEIDSISRLDENNSPLEGFEYETQENNIDDIFDLRNKISDKECSENIFGIVAQPSIFSGEELLRLTRMLNDDQRQFLLHVGHYFVHQTSSTSPLHLFVNGGAGVGKSLLIKALYQYLMIHHFNKVPGCNPDDVKILLCAYTGKAAFGIGGQTVHCAFGLPVSQCGHTMPQLSANIANSLACKLANVKLIVLDEISMLGSRTFHQINRRLQQIFHSNKPFAGISIIVVGDFRQLPPVGDNWVFQPNVSANPMALLAGAPLWEPFLLFQMEKIMRQRDDENFATALNNMASGTMTAEDISIFENRCFTKEKLPSIADGAIHLFSTNREVDQYNDHVLNTMKTEGTTVNAIDRVTGYLNEQAKQRALHTVSSLSTVQTYGLPKILTLKLEARYMITVNIDTEDGIVNGTTGRLKAIEYGKHVRTKEKRPLRLWFLFDDKNSGKCARNKFISLNRKHINNIQSNWTPLLSATYTIKRWKSNMTVQRTQFPVVAAEGITIHKSQGATMDKVVVHLTRNVRRSMLYVACSRSTSASGLFIVSKEGKFIPPRPPLETNPVVKEMKRLTSTCNLIPKYRFLQDVPVNTIQVIFHNIQCFNKHALDIHSDPIVSSSHLAFFVETWNTNNGQNLLLEGFNEMARIDGPFTDDVNRGWGSILFVRSDIVAEVSTDKSYKYCFDSPGGGHIECIQVQVADIWIISLYRSPGSSIHFATECLNKVLNATTFKFTSPVILVGDFNVDFRKSPNNMIFTYLQSKGLLSKITDFTTVDQTVIDNVFSNMGNLEVGVIETFFSHHKQLWIRFIRF